MTTEIVDPLTQRMLVADAIGDLAKVGFVATDCSTSEPPHLSVWHDGEFYEEYEIGADGMVSAFHILTLFEIFGGYE